MATNKSCNNLVGWLAATVHCIIYTLAVCLIMWNFDPIWILVVFLSHFPIDKFSLGLWYVKYIKGNPINKYLDDGSRHLTRREDIIEGGIMSIIYVVTDNTMHLLLMWGAYQIIY